MVRELRPVGRRRGARRHGPPGDRLGAGTMEPAPLAGEELVVRHLREEGVTERVAFSAAHVHVHDQHLAGDGGAQRVVERVGCRVAACLGHGGKQVVVDAPAGDGDDADDLACALAQRGQACEQDLAQRRRQARRPLARLGDQELLDEERVAVGSTMDPRRGVGIHGLAGDRLEHRGGLGSVETQEAEALDAARPLELGQPRQRRVATVELVRAQRHRGASPAPCGGSGPGRRWSRGLPDRPSGRPRRRSAPASAPPAGGAGR